MLVSSPDITSLDFKFLIDLSLATPKITVTNLSEVINAGNLKWAFIVDTPSGTRIHYADFTDPDIDGTAFTTFEIPEELPSIFGQVEFSNQNKYSVTVSVQDSEENVFTLTRGRSICKPSGNNGKNNFGGAIIEAETKCNSAQIHVIDKTPLIYKGVEGTPVSTTVKLSYPKDSLGNKPADVTVTILPALIPITLESEGYELYVANILDYDLGDNVFVRIRYSFKKSFAVWCSVNLCPLLCEIEKMTELVQKNCEDTADKREQKEKLQLINAKLQIAIIGIMQPLCGIDVPKKIDEIKEIGNFECDCCYPKGVNPIHDIQVQQTGALNFTTSKICGDAVLSWETDEFGNIVLKYRDKSYMVGMYPEQSEAFSFAVGDTQCTKTYALKVDMNILASEIVDIIQNDTNLIEIFNSIITSSNATICNNLDGQEIIDVQSCNYSLQAKINVPKVVRHVVINGTIYDAGDILATNTSAIQSFLNSLSLGGFTVLYDSGTKILSITSANNPNSLSNVAFDKLGVDSQVLEVVQFVNTCGNICTIFQKIIDYLKTISLINIQNGEEITVCKIVNGELVQTTYSATAHSNEVIREIAASLCIVSDMLSKGRLYGKVLFDSFESYLPANPDPNGADVFAMFVNGVPKQVPVRIAAKTIFSLLCSDAEVKSIFCQCGTCTTVSNCNPVTGLAATVSDTTATITWNAVVGAVGYKYSLDGTNYFSVTGTSKLLTSLTPNTAYNVRVHPVYNNGAGIDCEVTLNITTTNVGAACSAPADLTISGFGTNWGSATWDAVSGATGYQYRINGGSWVNIGNNTSVYLSGLTNDTEYTIAVRAIMGGIPCTDESTETFTTLESSVFSIVNDGSTVIITDVQPDTFYNITGGSLPVEPTETATGEIITNQSSPIEVTTTTDNTILTLKINGEIVQSLEVGAGTHEFDAVDILTSDNVEIKATV